jgi:hypothetical protein
MAMAEDIVRLNAIRELELQGRGEWAHDPREALRIPPEGPSARMKKRPARAISSPPVDRDATDQDRDPRSAQRWKGQASITKATSERVKHSTDAYISKARIPAEAFRDGVAGRDAWCDQVTDERGQINALPLLDWVFEGHDCVYEAAQSEEWKTWLHHILDVILKLDKQKRWKEIKSGGQGGENLHDYALSELRREAGYHLPKFKITLNPTYEKMLSTLDPYLEQRVRDWIRDVRHWTKPSKITETIGDFFEFAAMFFIGHERRDLLLQMAVVSFKTQYNMDNPDTPDQGDQDLEKAIAWQPPNSRR